MVVAVEALHMVRGVFGVGGDVVEVFIVGADPASAHELVVNEFFPSIPVAGDGEVGIAAGNGLTFDWFAFDEDDGDHGCFTGLDEGEGFIGFVEGSEATWEADDRFGLREEHEFSGEEVPEVDEFFIVGDDVVCGGFEGESDGDAEGGFASWTFVTGFHDAVAGAGDDHPSSFGHEFGKEYGGFVVGVVFRGSCGAEDGDLVCVCVFAEDSVCVSHFLERGGEEFEFASVSAVRDEFEGGGDEFADEACIVFVCLTCDIFDDVFDSFLDFAVVGFSLSADFGRCVAGALGLG